MRKDERAAKARAQVQKFKEENERDRDQENLYPRNSVTGPVLAFQHPPKPNIPSIPNDTDPNGLFDPEAWAYVQRMHRETEVRIRAYDRQDGPENQGEFQSFMAAERAIRESILRAREEQQRAALAQQAESERSQREVDEFNVQWQRAERVWVASGPTEQAPGQVSVGEVMGEGVQRENDSDFVLSRTDVTLRDQLRAWFDRLREESLESVAALPEQDSDSDWYMVHEDDDGGEEDDVEYSQYVVKDSDNDSDSDSDSDTDSTYSSQISSIRGNESEDSEADEADYDADIEDSDSDSSSDDDDGNGEARYDSDANSTSSQISKICGRGSEDSEPEGDEGGDEDSDDHDTGLTPSLLFSEVTGSTAFSYSSSGGTGSNSSGPFDSIFVFPSNSSNSYIESTQPSDLESGNQLDDGDSLSLFVENDGEAYSDKEQSTEQIEVEPDCPPATATTLRVSRLASLALAYDVSALGLAAIPAPHLQPAPSPASSDAGAVAEAEDYFDPAFAPPASLFPTSYGSDSSAGFLCFAPPNSPASSRSRSMSSSDSNRVPDPIADLPASQERAHTFRILTERDPARRREDARFDGLWRPPRADGALTVEISREVQSSPGSSVSSSEEGDGGGGSQGESEGEEETNSDSTRSSRIGRVYASGDEQGGGSRDDGDLEDNDSNSNTPNWRRDPWLMRRWLGSFPDGGSEGEGKGEVGMEES